MKKTNVYTFLVLIFSSLSFMASEATALSINFTGAISPSSGLLNPGKFPTGSPVTGTLVYDPSVSATSGNATTASYSDPAGSINVSFQGTSDVVSYTSVNPLGITLTEVGADTRLRIGVLVNKTSDTTGTQANVAEVFLTFIFPGSLVNGIGTPLPANLLSATTKIGNITTDNIGGLGLTGYSIDNITVVPVPSASWMGLGLLGALGLINGVRYNLRTRNRRKSG